MVPVLEAVPNLSEGRDPKAIAELADRLARWGVEVLDWSSDPDHHRSVVTFVGDPPSVENAAVATARWAVERVDLREHDGVHPRIGALDVLPLVPLEGVTMEEAVQAAHRVGRRIQDEVGLPVYFYGEASNPPGRRLAELRRGGFEALTASAARERRPDLVPEALTESGIHPTAGAVCVGARPVLLAWNVEVSGMSLAAVRDVASLLRERGGGFRGLRALGLDLRRQERMQISMNLEDLSATSPEAVFEALDREVTLRGGAVEATEVIGMIPDGLLLPVAAARLKLRDAHARRLLSHRLVRHLAGRDHPARPPILAEPAS